MTDKYYKPGTEETNESEKKLAKTIANFSLTSMVIGVGAWELGKVIVKTVKVAITGKLN